MISGREPLENYLRGGGAVLPVHRRAKRNAY
jgi:hypothetical protein